MVSQTSLLTKVSYPDDHVWACGKDVNKHTASCSLAGLITGEVVAQYQFSWDSVLSVLSTNTANSVVLSGSVVSNSAVNSDVAICNTHQAQIYCNVRTFFDTNFLAASFVPLPNTIVYVGWYNKYTSATLVDLTANTVRSYLYSAYNMKALTLTQIASPPYFVGGFVAGTTIRATATPVNYIVAGMVRTDAGILTAMVLMPQSGDIVNSVDLVNTMALENIGPDSFIAGGLLIDDGAGKHAYLLRANALFMTIQYCVRYRSASTGGGRRLSAGGETQSVTRGVVLADGVLFMIVEHRVHNVSALTVLKTSATDGSIIKQVHIVPVNATSVNCTDIASAATFLSILCYTTNATHPTSLLVLVDRELSFAVLPRGFARSEEIIFEEENVPFKRTVLSITKSNTVVGTSDYQFSTDDTKPTPRPSTAPSQVPSVQPSEVPSSQPTSSPSAAPSLSARPTSQPSSATPTNTHKPTVAPTMLPTTKPSVAPTARPSLRATPNPTARPTQLPTVVPTAKPTITPSALPTVAPRTSPSLRPTPAPSTRPSTAVTPAPTVGETVVSNIASDGSSMPKYVVGASVGSGLGLLLLGYVLYRHYEDKEEAKARDVRKAEYFRQQTLIAEAARAETAKYIEEENKRISAKRAEKLHINKSKNKGKQSRSGGGAFAAGPELEKGASLSPVPSSAGSAGSANSSSYNLSSLHSSENNFEQYKIKVRRARKREVVTEKSVHVVDLGVVVSVAGVGSFIRSGSVSDSDGSGGSTGSSGSSAYDSSGGSVDDDIARVWESGASDIADRKLSSESAYGEGSSDSSADESSVSASSDSTRSSKDYTRMPSPP